MGLTVLLIGIAIGYYATQFGEKDKIVILKPQIIIIPQLSNESKIINEFITESEIILLSLREANIFCSISAVLSGEPCLGLRSLPFLGIKFDITYLFSSLIILPSDLTVLDAI